jgi:amino acid transporter
VKITRGDRLPYNSILVTGVIAAALLFISTSKVYAVLISFTNAGFYTAFALPVLGAAWIRLRRRWQPGSWSTGRWGNLITYVTGAWLLAEIVNIAWPRASLYGAGYLSWSVLLMMGILAVAGIAVNAWAFRDGGAHTRSVALDLPNEQFEGVQP